MISGVGIIERNHSFGSRRVVDAVAKCWARQGVLRSLVRPARSNDDAGLPVHIFSELALRPSAPDRLLLGLARRIGGRIGVNDGRERILRDLAAAEGWDLVFDPWLFDVEPYRVPVPMVGMVMDLSWRPFPENFSKSTTEYDRRFVAAARRFDVLCPVSDCTARDVAAAFPELAPKLRTVPHGATLRPTLPAPTGPPTLYYPASVHWHKRHALLIEAFGRLHQRNPDVRLQLTGTGTDLIRPEFADGTDASAAASRVLATLDHATRVAVVGRGQVAWTEVEAAYQAATAVAIASAGEGFGLPFLEALEWDRPIVAADIPPFREQADRYNARKVIWVHSDDPTVWADALSEVLQPGRWEGVPPADLEAWTWDDAARAYLEAI